MKTVKSALLGNKQLADGNPLELNRQLSHILKEHRAIIINRLLNDLPNYLAYKFDVTRPSKNQMEDIRNKLLNLKNGNLHAAPYQKVFNELELKSLIHLTNEPFYVEIDECVQPLVSMKELKIF